MTDHADTTRWEDSGGAIVVAAADYDALLAVRQQAIDEAARWKAEADSSAAAVAHASDLQDEAEARCKQAIDALREFTKPKYGAAVNYKADAALVSLGETE